MSTSLIGSRNHNLNLKSTFRRDKVDAKTHVKPKLLHQDNLQLSSSPSPGNQSLVKTESADLGSQTTSVVEYPNETGDHLQADRIAHGVKTNEDPGVIQQFRHMGVQVEFCPRSNLLVSLEQPHQEF